MRLHKLILNNFQGCQHYELDVNGSNAVVYGTNGAGKSTLRNAYMWLLLGEAAVATNFDPRPYSISEDTQRQHYIETTVTGVFELDNEQILTLEKKYKENWQTKRGSADAEYTGNTTEYYIDGVSVKKRTYEDMLLQYANVDTSTQLKILTEPGYFAGQLAWQERAATLNSLIDEITVDDVIAANAELEDIRQLITKPDGRYYTISELEKMTNAAVKDIEKRIKELPIRIDEVTRRLPTLHETRQELNDQLDALSDKKNQLEQQRAAISLTDPSSEHRAKLAELDALISTKKAGYLQQYNDSVADDKQKLSELNLKRAEINSGIQIKFADTNALAITITRIKQRREQLAAELKAVQAEKYDGSSVCPVCGQELPQDMIDEAKGNFNEGKSHRIEQIKKTAASECSKDMLAKVEAELNKFNSEIESLRQQKEQLNNDILRLEEQIKPIIPFTETDEGKAMLDKRTQLQLAIGRDNKSEQLNEIDRQINHVAGEMETVRILLLSHDGYDEKQARIDQLKEESDRLKEQFSRNNYTLYLCKLFTRTRAKLLDESINGIFDTVRWQLYREQKNGGIEDCCEAFVWHSNGTWTAYNGADTNNAAVINAGLEIIDVLSRQWGTSMPVFVDGAESVVEIESGSLQTVCLKVSESDKTLRVVCEQ